MTIQEQIDALYRDSLRHQLTMLGQPQMGRESFEGYLDAIQGIYKGLAIWWIVGLAILIPVIWLIRRRGGYSRQADESPELTLDRRYARGEIDREDYEQRLADLRK